MLMKRIFAATFAAALLATGCAREERATEQEAAPPAEPESTVDIATEEAAVRNRSAEFMNYINAGDTTSLMDRVYADDAISVVGDDVARGADKLRAGFEKNFKNNPDAVYSWNPTDVKVAASGDLAVEKGDFYMDPDGAGRKPQVSGTYVTVWEKVDGEWRVTVDVAAENEPDKEQSAPAT